MKLAELRAEVEGQPMTYGSKRAFNVQPKGGGPPRPIISNQNHANLKDWQDTLRKRMAETAPLEIITEAVGVLVVFYLARPKGHYRTIGGRLTFELKDSASPYPLKKPDGDKVERAAWDCMKGHWIIDDTHVVNGQVQKRWADPGRSEKTVVCLWLMSEKEIEV